MSLDPDLTRPQPASAANTARTKLTMYVTLAVVLVIAVTTIYALPRIISSDRAIQIETCLRWHTTAQAEAQARVEDATAAIEVASDDVDDVQADQNSVVLVGLAAEAQGAPLDAVIAQVPGLIAEQNDARENRAAARKQREEARVERDETRADVIAANQRAFFEPDKFLVECRAILTEP